MKIIFQNINRKCEYFEDEKYIFDQIMAAPKLPSKSRTNVRILK